MRSVNHLFSQLTMHEIHFSIYDQTSLSHLLCQQVQTYMMSSNTSNCRRTNCSCQSSFVESAFLFQKQNKLSVNPWRLNEFPKKRFFIEFLYSVDDPYFLTRSMQHLGFFLSSEIFIRIRKAYKNVYSSISFSSNED